MDKLVIIFDDLLRLVRKRNNNHMHYNRAVLMIPALGEQGALIKFKNEDGIIDEQFTAIYDLKDDEKEIFYNKDIYVLTKHIVKEGKYIDDISDYDLKHSLHCEEIPLYSDRCRSEYVKVYIGR